MAWQEWCEDSSNLEDATSYESDTERQSGFLVNTPIHSVQMNTVLHNVSTITTAFANVVCPDNDADDTVSDLQGVISTYLGENIISASYEDGYIIFTKRDESTFAVQIPTERGNSMSNPMNAVGDIIIGGSNGTPIRLAKGTEGQVLRMSGSRPVWSDDFTDPTEYTGDMIYRDLSGNLARVSSRSVDSHCFLSITPYPGYELSAEPLYYPTWKPIIFGTTLSYVNGVVDVNIANVQVEQLNTEDAENGLVLVSDTLTSNWVSIKSLILPGLADSTQAIPFYNGSNFSENITWTVLDEGKVLTINSSNRPVFVEPQHKITYEHNIYWYVSSTQSYRFRLLLSEDYSDIITDPEGTPESNLSVLFSTSLYDETEAKLPTTENTAVPIIGQYYNTEAYIPQCIYDNEGTITVRIMKISNGTISSVYPTGGTIHCTVRGI